MDLQGSARSMWSSPGLELVLSTTGFEVAEFSVGGFFAPLLVDDLNMTMESLNIDVSAPPRW
jgi:hypothetical protein